MAYPGRQNIYESTIRRMVTQAIDAQEQQFHAEHELDPDEVLLTVLRDWVTAHGHTPWPAEMVGGSDLVERFGSWEQVIALAGLKMPTHPNKPHSFDRIREETERQKELYRRKKAEKKQLAQKRLEAQAARRHEREKR